MARREPDEDRELTADEQRVQRLLSMALVFTNATRPLTTMQVNTAFYPDVEGETFSRRFLRDRGQLASIGTVIVQTQTASGDIAWQLDEASSFPGPQSLSMHDAVVVDLVCRPLMSDPTFPYPDALASALEKVDGSFDGLLPGARQELRRPNTAFRTLRGCFDRRQLARISYVDAAGRRSERTIATYGSFDLREHVYLVAVDMTDEGGPASDPRVFRADRVSKAQPVPGSRYVVPDDFDPADYKVLPFQIGQAAGEVAFAVPEGRVHEVRHDALGRGTWEETPNGVVLRTDVSDPQAAASWAIAEGIRPLSPETVVSAWRQLLEGVLSDDRR
jgi:predicted DNA-binding transcriptional regulator YafY